MVHLRNVELGDAGRYLTLMNGNGDEKRLHALWLRERSIRDGDVDPVNHQRLYEPAELPPELAITAVDHLRDDRLAVRFSDAVTAEIDMAQLAVECGWSVDPQLPPLAEPWDATLAPRPEADFEALADPTILQDLLAQFFRRGFCVVYNVPPGRDGTRRFAETFGYIRETNFGQFFDVVKRSATNMTDLAYSSLRLSAHTDNPYRNPVPGIQFLHCWENSVAGGLSTLVDSFALIEQLGREAPEQVRVLEETPVRFRYETNDTIIEDIGPLIERTPSGSLLGVRFSPRLDYVPPLDPDVLDIFYAGRRRLYELAEDPRFQIRYVFEPGMALMMDNRRTLHGRTAYDSGKGHRHLCGCYIDHDGPNALYRKLARDGAGALARDNP